MADLFSSMGMEEPTRELEPNSLINVSCSADSEIVWDAPVLKDAIIISDGFTSTLLIYNATVNHTGYYECKYGSEQTDIYIYVKGKKNG